MTDNQPSAPGETSSPTKGHLLLVDDDPSFSDGFSRLLLRYGYNCSVAQDAEVAQQCLREKDIDALITDIHMPGHSGLELIQVARELRKGLPTFLCTGQPTWETAARSIGLHVTGYIAKPPVFAEFLPRLTESIECYRRSRSIFASCADLEQWIADLRAIETQLTNRQDTSDAARDYLRLTLHHIAVQLAGLATSPALLPNFEQTNCQAQNLAFAEALRHAISVLEETRKSFKSKELGELRKQLSALLSNPAPGQRAPIEKAA